jgi:vancomycin resistance protein VanW
MMDTIAEKLRAYESPGRRALSSRYPKLKGPIIFVKKRLRFIKNYATLGAPLKKENFLNSVIARHSSLLYRKLGDTDPGLQISKVHNLKLAIEKLNGLVIPSGKIFSFWHQVGEVNTKSGYKEGLTLANGKPARGIGGGLCQMSNFLFWIFLHADIKIIERYHHSVDAFPDSGRTLPFGSGATIFSNYLDLKIQNISDQPIQLKLRLTDTQLKGQLLSNMPAKKKFHITEANHCFIKKGPRYFRYNEILRNQNRILTNFAPVAYPITPDYIRANNYTFLEVN